MRGIVFLDWGFSCVTFLTVVRFYAFILFQPNSVAAKLLKGKSRRGGDLAEFHHQTSSGGKDKATDASSRTAHYGVPQAPAKTPVISTLPLSNQRKQPVAGGSNFYQTKDNNNTFNSYNRQGQTQRLSVPTTTRGHSHSSRVNSQRRRRSDSHRHLLQVSHITLLLFIYSFLHLCSNLLIKAGFGFARSDLL